MRQREPSSVLELLKHMTLVGHFRMTVCLLTGVQCKNGLQVSLGPVRSKLTHPRPCARLVIHLTIIDGSKYPEVSPSWNLCLSASKNAEYVFWFGHTVRCAHFYERFAIQYFSLRHLSPRSVMRTYIWHNRDMLSCTWIGRTRMLFKIFNAQKNPIQILPFHKRSCDV